MGLADRKSSPRSAGWGLTAWAPVFKGALKLMILTAMVAWLPLMGVWIAGRPVGRYLRMEPELLLADHAPFSWVAFAILAFGFVSILTTALVVVMRARAGRLSARPVGSFPWWGWAFVSLGAVSWTLAWTRFGWFAPFQEHTFVPLWLAYIGAMSGLTQRRLGSCFARRHPGAFALLFPISGVFWWFFEYLNRFSMNWGYTLRDFSMPGDYILKGLLPFATILPAILCTQEWLSSFPRLVEGLHQLPAVHFSRSRQAGFAWLLASAVGLYTLGLWPDLTFPMLWLAPLLILWGLSVILDQRVFFCRSGRLDWARAGTFAAAALWCGFFWEMWNYLSLAKWEYAIPYVGRYHLFEMPVLGYMGYLPFGLQCGLVLHLFLGGRLAPAEMQPAPTSVCGMPAQADSLSRPRQGPPGSG